MKPPFCKGLNHGTPVVYMSAVGSSSLDYRLPFADAYRIAV